MKSGKIAWGIGIWDNDDATDVLNSIWSLIERRYFTKSGEIKKSVSNEALLAIADLLGRFDRIASVGRPSEKMIVVVYDTLILRNVLTESSKSYKKRKKVVDKLYRILNT